jgi:Flavin containing amine oxidoreductase
MTIDTATESRQLGDEPSSGNPRVAVFGAGTGGMTVAHELAERGFAVELFERHAELGGKCRSFSLPGTGKEGRADLPGEVGPHAIFGSYRNLGETLQRVPIRGGGSLIDNLVPIGGGAFAWDGIVFSQSNRNRNLRRRLSNINAARRLIAKMSLRDAALLVTKSVALYTSGPKRQWNQLEDMSVADFYGVDQMSLKAVSFMPTWLSGAPKEADLVGARSFAIGSAISTYLGPSTYGFGSGFYRYSYASNGPMSSALFDPWADHLRHLGVMIHMQQRLTDLKYQDGRIVGATVVDAEGAQLDVQADYYVLATPADKAAELMTPDLISADPALGRIAELDETWLGCMQVNLTNTSRSLDRPVTMMLGQPWVIAVVNPSGGFWRHDFASGYGDGTVVQHLSIDVANWTVPGVLYGKIANECSPQELFEEIRAQIRLEVGDKTAMADADVHSWVLNPALFKNGNEPYVHDEPGFSNAPGSWQNRPEAATAIPNLFLGASYVRSSTVWDNMDGANEAGKKAANAVIAASGVPAFPATVDDFGSPPRLMRWLHRLDDRRYERGRPNPVDLIAPVYPTS